MNAGTFKALVAMGALWAGVGAAETIVVGDEVQVRSVHRGTSGTRPDHGGRRGQVRGPADPP